MNIEATYARYLELTGSAEAAATLVLAASRDCEETTRTVLTPPQVAKQLGTTPETVIGWIESGELKAANVGKGQIRPRYRIRREDVDAFLTHRVPEPPRRRRRKAREDGSFKLYRA